jgi:hypothetical protein
MGFDPELVKLLESPASRAVYLPTYHANANRGGVAAQLQADPKKQGKEKKPDRDLVMLVFPG